MLPSRFSVQSSNIRKSRLEGKASLLPLPRRPGSTDRLSTEARRPSAAGHRSSSAEPPRGTLGVRFSREASATKLPINRRSRSQTGEAKYGATATPLRNNPHSRPTTTPVRTPSKDRESWQSSLERAQACVTIKDQRPISSAAWQRAEITRVSEGMAARGAGAALVRPLTIARFVDIVAVLLAPLSTRDHRLNTDNYVAKLPHLLKRMLYPGAVSKSWLKTVNTLHAFPHALALIAYLLDLVTHVEMPVPEESLYLEKDEVSCLRRDYLYKCWIRFQEPNVTYDDLNTEYLDSLNNLLGNNDDKIAHLQDVVKRLTADLEDEAERAARADEARRVARRDARAVALRGERATRRAVAADISAARAGLTEAGAALAAVTQQAERAAATLTAVCGAVEAQTLTREQRAALTEQLEYAQQVLGSKRQLMDTVSGAVGEREAALAGWRRAALDACVSYKRQLIHLAARAPNLATLAVDIDEKAVIESDCTEVVNRAVEALRAEAARLSERRAAVARQRTADTRQRAAKLQAARARVAELRQTVERETAASEAECAREAAAAAAWADEELRLLQRLERLRDDTAQHERPVADLRHWETQEQLWKSKLGELKEYVEAQRADAKLLMAEAIEKRVKLYIDHVRVCSERLDQLTSQQIP
ncbi:kinetochore protein NDC80 homolog [Aricia agestis]|uniref:kinetochore protein NDC80 homolog n=1 Tax=Aricia agestis TaxID=91739 RepID=UPI001C20C03B|nr:kinetochore protein NDC80 homolog [Aricia agestis]